MARTGCAFAAVTCLCCPARTHRDRQVLPAYGLQDLPIKTQNPSRGSKPNTMWLPITLGESLGRGHFYLAETRTFLLCVDTNLPAEHAPSGDHEVQLPGNGIAGNWPPCTIKKMILRLTWTATCSAISYLRGKVSSVPTFGLSAPVSC